MGEQNRHTPQGEMEGGQNVFITFCVDAKSLARPCSAEQRSTQNGLEVSKETFLPLPNIPHLGTEQVYSNSVCFFQLPPSTCLVPHCCLANHT